MAQIPNNIDDEIKSLMASDNVANSYDNSETQEESPVSGDSIYDIRTMLSIINLASEIDEEELKNIGEEVYTGFELDLQSRSQWEEKYKDYIALATLIAKNKTYPWPNAANIKYPLLAIASMQFAARAEQTLLPGNKLVKVNVVGEDKDNKKSEQGVRVSNYMSYQLLEEMEDWEDNMDRLCLVLPIIGNVFKKTYYDQGTYNVCSELILPTDLVVNYYSKSLESAPRKTHIIPYYPNEVLEQIRRGDWLDHDYEQTGQNQETNETQIKKELLESIHGVTEPSGVDVNSPIEYLEQHTFYDLDQDGYREPLIITINRQTKEVVRIVANFTDDSIEVNQEGDVVKIIPEQYFTNFIFVPAPDSGVYGIGFGHLLGPINEVTNTIINQLLDAGSLQILPSGFIAKGIRLQSGNLSFVPGEWKVANTSGENLKNRVIPLPVQGPSDTLFKLLGMMIESGFQLGSVTDLMQGKNPGQNQPFSTTSEVLRQGLQMYSSIHKRMHRALKREFRKIFKLNYLYLDDEKYFSVLDPSPHEQQQKKISKEDFNVKTFNIFPASDPNQLSQIEKIEKAKIVVGLVQLGTINRTEATKQVLESWQIPNIKELMAVPPPEPTFEQQIEMKKVQLQEQSINIDKFKAEYQAARDQANSMLAMAKAQAEKASTQMEGMGMKFEALMKTMELKMGQMDLQGKTLDIERERVKLEGQKNKNAEMMAQSSE